MTDAFLAFWIVCVCVCVCVFLVGGKGGNASCTVALLSAVCGTPTRLASGPIITRWTKVLCDRPTKTLLRQWSRPHPVQRNRQ